jgi:penicillin-binding protein 2
VTSPPEPSTAHLRLTVVIVVTACLFGSLLARLWFLQVINAPTAQLVSEGNGVRIVYTEAPRGDILDDQGRVLVGNVNEPVIEVQRQQVPTGSPVVARLAALMGTSVSTVDGLIANDQYAPFTPVPVLQSATPAQILYVQEHQSLFAGVEATTETVRSYSPLGIAAANIVGYVGQITGTQLTKLAAAGYQPGDQIGQAGVEATYESVLRGTPGITRVQVNSQGQVLGDLSSSPPVQGHDLRLSIDGVVQQEAVDALEQGLAAAKTQYDSVTSRDFDAPAGSAVVEDPQNGTILALATYPCFDPRQFVGGISEADYRALMGPAAYEPLLDRTIQGAYAPGSTFKLVTATAALKDGLITPTQVFADHGSIKIGNQTFHNDDGEVLGDITMSQAITESSDVFFNQLGADFWDDRATLGDDALQKVAEAYGFGEPTGIDLPDEDPGLVPSPKTVAEAYKQYPQDYATGTWYTGDSAQMAIGQFEDEVTPLQLANAYSSFANGGTVYQPRVALDAQTQSGRVVHTYLSKVHATVMLPAADHASMLQGFEGVVSNPKGTAYGDFANTPLAGDDIAGKTGTAQVTGAGKQATSVFTSFAPASNPRYEVTALCEDAGYGATIAAPVVRQIYDQLFGLPLQPVTAVAASGNAT